MHPQDDEHRLVAVRKQKIAAMRQEGVEPYPLRTAASHSLQQAAELFAQAEAASGSADSEGGARTEPVSVAGRVMSVREFGKMAFLVLASNGARLQVQFRKDILEEQFGMLKWLDMGDFLRAEGPLFRTRQGEVTLEAHNAAMLGKAIKPLPEKWAGLQDSEARRRQPYLALISQPEAMQIAASRAKVTAEIRRFMAEQNFTELETNILTAVAAGAVAHPFETLWRASGKLYLRIATELALKKALVGGFERVYEIGKVFRNEGADKDHSPEFTTMEAYQAFASYEEMMALTETLMARLAMLVNGSTEITLPGGQKVDLKPPWRRLDLHAALMEHADVDFNAMRGNRDALVEHMVKMGAINETNQFMRHKASWGRLVDKLISDRVEPTLQQPCFLVDYPVETTPFAKVKEGTEATVERAEAFIGGMEIANMFTELNDPVEQRERMMEQERIRREFKNEEADRLDKDFLNAMDYCMPPAGGIGIGIDRIVMLLTGAEDIGDVLLFPNLYRKEEEQG